MTTQEERDSQLRRQRELQNRRQRAEDLAGSLENERSAMLDRYESLQARVHALSTTLENIQTQAHDIQDRVDSEASDAGSETIASSVTSEARTSPQYHPQSSHSPLRATGSSSMRTTWSSQTLTPPREQPQSNNARGSPRWGYRSSGVSNSNDRGVPNGTSDVLEDSLQSLESQISQSPGGSPRRERESSRDHPPNN